MYNVTVVDYGVGNLKSIQRGLEKIGATVSIITDPCGIAKASRLILPGVGAFNVGMNSLKDAGIIDSINDFVKTGNPLLGICLGMQMFLDQSDEHGVHQGLGLISGRVKKIPKNIGGDFSRKIPHIGWGELQIPEHQDWKRSCLENIKEGECFYFVHSYMAEVEKKDNILALCKDESFSVVAAIKKNNVTGLQFHPEKSGEAGLKVLSNFVEQ